MVLACGLLSSSGLASAESAGKFTELCESKDTPADVRKTIDVLLNQANTKDCAAGEDYLNRQTYFEVIGKGITNIEPLLLFPNISSLNLKDNNITSIAGVGTFKKLTRLDIRRNKVSDISPANGLQRLRMLYAQNNQITSLGKLTDLPKARIMNFNDNPITDISDLPQFKSLVSIHFAKSEKGGPSLGDLSPLGRIASLKGLTLKNNGKITNISSLKKIQTLNVAGTGLKDLSEVSTLPDLKRLEISDNPLSTPESIADLSKMTGLTTLNMFKTGIADISVVAELEELTYLDLSDNKIETIAPLKELEKVTRFILQRNPLGTTIKRTEENCPTTAASEIIAHWCKWDGR